MAHSRPSRNRRYCSRTCSNRANAVRTTCSVNGCQLGVHSTGMCRLHWDRWRKHGDPLHTRWPDWRERVRTRLDVVDSGCWNWRGYIGANGYGTLWYNGTNRSAHVAAYIASKGPLPERTEIDHLCFNRRCVNPDHLEAVTRSENARRRAAHRRSLQAA
jgi:hypothetical protein